MRGALIGCGFFAQNHLHAWCEMRADGVELVAVCDMDQGRAQAAADNFGISRSYVDAAEMLAAEKLDFVDIATQMSSHQGLAALAARHGLAMIVQKPLAPDWVSAAGIVKIARQGKVRLAVHENFRYQAPMLAVAEALRGSAIGDPTWAKLAFRTSYDVYRTQPYFHHEKRLAILDVGIHVLDLARVFLGEVEGISCEIQTRNSRNAGEDTATMLLRHASGAVSVVECTYEALLRDDPFPQTLVSIEGTHGSIELDADFQLTVTRGVRGHLDSQRTRAAPPPRAWTQDPWRVTQESVLATQRAILSAWRAGEEAGTSGEDNLKTFALVEAAYLAASEGRRVRPLALQY